MGIKQQKGSLGFFRRAPTEQLVASDHSPTGWETKEGYP